MRTIITIMFSYIKKYFFAVGVIYLLAGCAATSSLKNNRRDPLEKINRVTFAFNDKLDVFIIRPCATVYNKIMPKPLNVGLDNMFDNVGSFSAVINDLLQANFHQVVSDSWRLCINSTVGLGGFFDVASAMKLKKNQEDFGLTLVSWGYTNSSYFVVPFLGPKTIRDTISLPLDYFISPYSRLQDISARNTYLVLRVLDKRARLLRFQGIYDEMAIDPYVFVRNAYLQNRKHKIKRNIRVGDSKVKPAKKQEDDDYYLDE